MSVVRLLSVPIRLSCDAGSTPSSHGESAQPHTEATERTSDEAAACTAINGKAAQSPTGAG